ncbi:MAG: hypothetical protein V1789_05865 [PVC group bacterium]
MTAMILIPRKTFRPPPPPVADLLASLAEYQAVPGWPRDCHALADAIADSKPFTIILFAEPLAPERCRRKSHTIMRRVELVSELDETVYRYFDRELNARMADWVRNHPDPDDTHLKRLVWAYYPRARQILRAEYRERYPRTWKRRWAEGGYLHPRRKMECRRRYDLPAPLGLWSTAVPQQFYFMRRSKTCARGCGTGSGSREVHSYFGLAFLELSRRGASIPSHILIYDKHNRLLLADSLTSFAFYPASIGSNCSESSETVQRLMQAGFVVTAVTSDDYSEISEIKLFKDELPRSTTSATTGNPKIGFIGQPL